MCASFTLLAFAHEALAERQFRKLGVGRGLEVNVATSMIADRNGLLWVSSREGLFRYDGYAATVFRPDPNQPGSISDTDVRALFEADDGTLWASTNTGGLNRRDPVSGQFTQFHHDSANSRSLSNESAFGVAQDAEGNLWVGTQNGLNRLDGKGLDGKGRDFTRFFHDPDNSRSLASNWVYALHLGPSKSFWIGTVGGGIDRWDAANESFEHFQLSKLAQGSADLDRVFALHESADGRVWAGTRMGLVELDPLRRTAALVRLDVPEGQVPLITGMHADSDHRLWLSTLSHGAFIFDLATRRSRRAHAGNLGQQGNFPAPGQISIAGTDSTIFVGTWGSGVYAAPLEDPQFRLLTETTDGRGLRHKNVTAVLGSSIAGKPWVGSFGGGPQQVDVVAGTVAPAGGSATDTIRVSGILSLAVTPDGSHFGGSTEGLFRFAADGSRLGLDANVKGRSNGLGEGYVGALLPDASGLWVGVGGSGLFRRELSRPHFRNFQHDPRIESSLSGDYITALAAGRAGKLWVGTRSNGLNLCRIEPWSCERFDGRSANARNIGHYHVTALQRDRVGALWVATAGAGIHRVNEDAQGRAVSIEHWDVTRGLLNNAVMAVESDDDGSLWLSTRFGLSRLDPVSGHVVNHVRESGLPVSHFNTGASSADSNWLYFGSVDGLLSIPRGTALRPRKPTRVQVTAIESLTRGTEMPMPPGQLTGGFETKFGDGLAFEFAVLDFSETTHEYAYRLKADDPWTAVGRRRQLTFFGLAAGPYLFQVRGRDAFGHWNTSPVIDFEVVPPFWRARWFTVLASVSIVLLAFGLHRMRLRTLRRRNAVLEQLQRQREHALEQAERSQRELAEAYAGLRQLMGRLESAKEEERTRISRELHDEFGQTLTAAKINLQMLRRVTNDSAVAQRLEDSVNMIDGMIRQARNIALNLRPPLLDEAGLVAALDHHLKALAGRSGVPIELDAAGAGANIPPSLNTTVFRLVQEAVSNALRHAQAESIHVTLQDDANELRLVIEDDGVGFDQDAVAKRAKRGEHLGLLGMTERVRSAGGTIVLDSRPGHGSRIEVRIPLGSTLEIQP